MMKLPNWIKIDPSIIYCDITAWVKWGEGVWSMPCSVLLKSELLGVHQQVADSWFGDC